MLYIYTVLKYLLSTFPLLYTSLPHDLIKAKVLSLVNCCFNRESYVLQTKRGGGGVAARRMTRINSGLSLGSSIMENIYMYAQFEAMVYQQMMGIHMGTNYTGPLVVDLFLYCYERYFMSRLHKSKQYALIDMFNDTSIS